MNKPAKRLRQILADSGIEIEQLGDAIGVSAGTIRNVLSGNSNSRIARQKISDYFAANIWPDVKARTAIGTITESAVVLRLSKGQATALHNRFPDSTRVLAFGDGNVHGPFGIEFLKDTPAIFDLKNPDLRCAGPVTPSTK